MPLVSHPRMFDEDDPLLARVRKVCLALPGAEERVTHGRPGFFCAKLFAVYGGGVKVRPGEHEAHERSVMVKIDPGELPALDADDRFWFPAYIGGSGWRGLDVDAPDTDWGEVAELVDASYRLVAPRRLVAELEQRGAAGA